MVGGWGRHECEREGEQSSKRTPRPRQSSPLASLAAAVVLFLLLLLPVLPSPLLGMKLVKLS